MEENDDDGVDDDRGVAEEGGSTDGGESVSAVERAKELQAELVTLRLRERTANFENREALRRAIRERERELRELGGAPAGDGGDGRR